MLDCEPSRALERHREREECILSRWLGGLAVWLRRNRTTHQSRASRFLTVSHDKQADWHADSVKVRNLRRVKRV